MTDWSRGQGWNVDALTGRERLQRAWFDLRTGLRLGYPRCCVLMFVIGPLLGATKGGRRRGSCRCPRPDGTVKLWVPCRWHMRRGPDWRSHGDRWKRAREVWLLDQEVRRVVADLVQREHQTERLIEAASQRGVDRATLSGLRDLLGDEHDVYVGIDWGGEEPAVYWHRLS